MAEYRWRQDVVNTIDNECRLLLRQDIHSHMDKNRRSLVISGALLILVVHVMLPKGSLDTVRFYHNRLLQSLAKGIGRMSAK
ncbi:Uu.00g136120.m01.CDS01 [Anthostomella pinea]|uniref:Uu.00g136120.m01.CDS01 n=1 Tax=Anthostomella pinea TaxID=933095 RepID=A0AAI8VPA9_9PEZI|nr:Uu.00g136120.m01.CDS01 [Anthostomella pinea]